MRKWLLPFSLIYGAGASAYHKLYDLQIKKSVEFDLPVISIGNLTTGGTGKTPHGEYLVEMLRDNYKVGVLSRGYGRRSKGFVSVEVSSSFKETGDEPLQIKRKFPDVSVAVCEERALGIPIMLLDDPQLQVIILDDAFQHRQVKPLLSILLTEFAKPYTKDYLLPAGNLREPLHNAVRADIIIVTKCPYDISIEDKKRVSAEIKQRDHQKVFFSFLKYGEAYSLLDTAKKAHLSEIEAALLITGIASPEILVEEVQAMIQNVVHLKYRDHYSFSEREVQIIAGTFQQLKANRKIILTTEKDGVRLLPFYNFFINHQLEIYCIPVEIEFNEQEKGEFENCILNSITTKLTVK